MCSWPSWTGAPTAAPPPWHNAGPVFHKFSVCLRVPGELEPVSVAVASTPKARRQMDGETLEINRCCAPRYADVCSCLYARAVRIGRELEYRRFLTYTLPEESESSLRAVGFQLDGMTKASAGGWNSPSRPRGIPPTILWEKSYAGCYMRNSVGQ